MAQANVYEGTPDQLAQLMSELPKSMRYRVIVTAASLDAAELPPSTVNGDTDSPVALKPDQPSSELDQGSKSLAEIFAGRTGGLHGGGRAWSEDTGSGFAEGMRLKYGAEASKTLS